jgi:peptide/nickel transport system substrate-binding protein
MRFSRRAMLMSAAVGFAAAVMAPQGLRAQDGGEPIRLAVAAGGPRALDPNQITQGADNWVADQMFEQLVRPPNGRFATVSEEFIPTLAKSWQVSDDAKTWTFQLREGVQFQQDFGKLTAEDVVFTFDRAKKEGVAAAIYANIASIEATGPLEVTFKLIGSDPLFLGSTIYQPTSHIVSKAAAEQKGDNFRTDAIGTGPYQLERFDPETGVYLTRFENYWGEPAKTEKVEILHIADTTARTLAIVSGEVDMIEAVRAPGWVQQIQAQDASLVVDMTDPGSFNTLHINLTRPPFDDLRVRQALATAIDRDMLANALAPMAKPSWTLSPPSYPTGWVHDDLPEDLRYDYDPDRARALLAEAGHPDGITFEASVSQREDYRSIMLILQEMMRPAGIDMQLNILDHSAYQSMIREDANTLSLVSTSFPPVPLDYYSRYLSSIAEVKSDGKGGYNYSHYGVAMPGADEAIERMHAASSLDDYITEGREIELQVLRDLPLISLVTLGYTVIRDPRVDLGYKVEGGYARWRLDQAVKS